MNHAHKNECGKQVNEDVTKKASVSERPKSSLDIYRISPRHIIHKCYSLTSHHYFNKDYFRPVQHAKGTKCITTLK